MPPGTAEQVGDLARMHGRLLVGAEDEPHAEVERMRLRKKLRDREALAVDVHELRQAHAEHGKPDDEGDEGRAHQQARTRRQAKRQHAVEGSGEGRADDAQAVAPGEEYPQAPGPVSRCAEHARCTQQRAAENAGQQKQSGADPAIHRPSASLRLGAAATPSTARHVLKGASALIASITSGMLKATNISPAMMPITAGV